MNSAIVFHGQSFLICDLDEGLGDRSIFIAEEPIYELNRGATTPQALWLYIKTLIEKSAPGGGYKLKERKTWSITVDKRGINNFPDTIRFWYPGSLDWGGYAYRLEQFKNMPVYEANDLLEKLRQFA